MNPSHHAIRFVSAGSARSSAALDRSPRPYPSHFLSLVTAPRSREGIGSGVTRCPAVLRHSEPGTDSRVLDAPHLLRDRVLSLVFPTSTAHDRGLDLLPDPHRGLLFASPSVVVLSSGSNSVNRQVFAPSQMSRSSRSWPPAGCGARSRRRSRQRLPVGPASARRRHAQASSRASSRLRRSTPSCTSSRTTWEIELRRRSAINRTSARRSSVRVIDVGRDLRGGLGSSATHRSAINRLPVYHGGRGASRTLSQDDLRG